MKDVKLKKFIVTKTSKETMSLKECKEWVEAGENIQLVGCFERKNSFRTSPIEKVDIEKNVVITKSGSEYHIVGVDDEIREIHVIKFVINNYIVFFENELDTVKNWIDSGKIVICHFETENGVEGTTSAIKELNVEEKTFITESGSKYHFTPDNVQ